MTYTKDALKEAIQQKLRLNYGCTEKQATDGEIMRIGNTQTHVRFSLPPDAYMDEWFRAAPTHHFALSIGRNARLFVKLAKLLDIESVVIG
mgnify:CR=1 FL=1